MNGNNENLEYLSDYATSMEAESIKGLLKDNGIECVLKFDEIGDVLGSVGVETGPTKIYVATEQLKKAQEILGIVSKS